MAPNHETQKQTVERHKREHDDFWRGSQGFRPNDHSGHENYHYKMGKSQANQQTTQTNSGREIGEGLGGLIGLLIIPFISFSIAIIKVLGYLTAGLAKHTFSLSKWACKKYAKSSLSTKILSPFAALGIAFAGLVGWGAGVTGLSVKEVAYNLTYNTSVYGLEKLGFTSKFTHKVASHYTPIDYFPNLRTLRSVFVENECVAVKQTMGDAAEIRMMGNYGDFLNAYVPSKDLVKLNDNDVCPNKITETPLSKTSEEVQKIISDSPEISSFNLNKEFRMNAKPVQTTRDFFIATHCVGTSNISLYSGLSANNIPKGSLGKNEKVRVLRDVQNGRKQIIIMNKDRFQMFFVDGKGLTPVVKGRCPK